MRQLQDLLNYFQRSASFSGDSNYFTGGSYLAALIAKGQ